MKKKVVVAMSGGVDSSTAAFLLKEEGHEVIGVSLDLYDFSDIPAKRAGTCCSLEDIYDARDVCFKLGIPHYVFNYRDLFDKEVIKDFVTEYASGRTPNPCVICNDVIKFRVLIDRARMLGANYLATGHYARIIRDQNGQYRLLKGTDEEKDQSYFLYRLNQKNIPFVLFPCGNYRKEEVRKIASDAGLPVKDKGESQEICFITEKSYRDFLLKKGLNENEGEIVSVTGKVLGQHRGIFRYTIGQRRGINIATDVPHYVVHLDLIKNKVVVGPLEYLFSSGAFVEQVSFTKEGAPFDEFTASAKVRYRSLEVSAKVIIGETWMKVFFDKKVKSVTPGQALVLYQGEEVLGGGIIRESIPGVNVT